ncbi:hypothetical protein EZV62_025981 [Acer yangbiense]|uniref:Integrase catalytic domain-containing protein n=1 Tax=Acer yangbiense TaxID=1000413 RepID=A0A5C7H1E2_9ROSI|nr:hypothetical protein EZV62_025981 [Acer yangbiense]
MPTKKATSKLSYAAATTLVLNQLGIKRLWTGQVLLEQASGTRSHSNETEGKEAKISYIMKPKSELFFNLSIQGLPFARVEITAKEPLELVYSDIWGPSPTLSTEGFRYYISFIDSTTRFVWIFPLKLKSDALATFIKFQRNVELQFGKKIKSLHSDMGGEYIAIAKYLATQGIQDLGRCRLVTFRSCLLMSGTVFLWQLDSRIGSSTRIVPRELGQLSKP